MEAVDKSKIKANYIQLVRNLMPEDVTDYLYQEGVLTEEDIERIMAEPVRAQKVRVLLSILPLRRKEGLTRLLEVMKENGYYGLVNKIEGTVYTEDQLGMNKNKELSKSVLNLHLVELKDQLEEQSQFVKALQCEIEEGRGLNEDLAGTIKREKSAKKKLVEKVYNAAQQEMNAEIEDVLPDTVTAIQSVEEAKVPATVTLPTNHHTAIKCLVVGDGTVGKTCLLISCTTDFFLPEYVSTVYDNFKTTLKVMHNNISTNVKIDFWDTSGQEDYDRLRPLSYPNTDVVLILFSPISTVSLDNVLAKWLPEVQHHLPGVPCILVGTKADLHDDGSTRDYLESKRQHFIKEKTANMVAQKHNFAGGRVFTTSALTQQGLKELMDFMIHTAFEYRSTEEVEQPHQNECCSIL